ncbi:uncharacterized protein METZ01_LOCUS105667 [marine metagenome]|uniref:Uncharacterized protein n=1 Tax=marine metagenome TaxID=408172 RepID=A0A381WLP5_9ZZZZ
MKILNLNLSIIVQMVQHLLKWWFQSNKGEQ